MAMAERPPSASPSSRSCSKRTTRPQPPGWSTPPPGAALGSVWLATDGIDQGLAEQERSVLLSAERAARSTAEGALGLLEAILTSAPVGIAVFDLDLRYVRVNDAYAELSGVP